MLALRIRGQDAVAKISVFHWLGHFVPRFQQTPLTVLRKIPRNVMHKNLAILESLIPELLDAGIGRSRLPTQALVGTVVTAGTLLTR
jgi:hypothetical protein